MKKSILIYLITLLALSMTFGQSADRIQRELVSLRTKIVRMQQLATRYHAPRLQEGLDLALVKLNAARDLLSASPNKFKEALVLYKEARHLAEAAARLLSVKPALKVIAELDRSIQKSEQAVQKHENAEARYLLNRARTFRTKALTAFEQAEFEKAQEFHRIGLYFSEKAYQLVYGDNQTDSDTQRYQRVVTNLNRLYQELSTQDSDPGLRLLVTNAAGALQEARWAYEQGNLKRALAQLQISERLLFRATDISEQSGEGKQRNVENNLRSLERYIDGVETTLGADISTNQRQLLRKARNFMLAAARDVNGNQYRTAETKIALSQRMATRALSQTGTSSQPDGTRLAYRINELERVMGLQAASSDDQIKSLADRLHPRARAILQQARQDLEEGRARQAYGKYNFCLRLVNRIDAAGRQPNEDLQVQDIQSRYQQITALLGRLQNQTGINPAAEIVLPELEQLLNQVQQLIENNELWTARQLLSFIQNQLQQIVRNGAGK